MGSAKRETVCTTERSAYKHWTQINLRYGDTDRQGHINNAVYCTLLEAGRVDSLFIGLETIAGPNTAFVIAKLSLDYLNEMNFPGIAEVGTGMLSLGRTSFRMGQCIFKDGICVCTAESVIVLTEEHTHRPIALPDSLIVKLDEISL
ncbi:MAG: acyl-CoA thioesterase [Candidatus Obscuribacterales bacterium]|nr:acyl-CoA thioesterase [Candidatus Obscuribacterales bacterium]